MNQTCDPTVDDIAGTSSVNSILHVKSLSQTCWTAGASATKVAVDQRRESVKALQTLEADASLLWDVNIEARGQRRNLLFFPILFGISYSSQLAITEKLSEDAVYHSKSL